MLSAAILGRIAVLLSALLLLALATNRANAADVSGSLQADFATPDPRWQTRHTPTPDLPAADWVPRTTAKGRLLLRLAKREQQVYTSHLAVLDRTFVYGRFEARMRFMGPRGAHSGFWLQDADPDRIGGSEVDIVEHFGHKSVRHSVHWRTPSTLWPAKPETWTRRTTGVDPRKWHIYGLVWRPNRYVFTVDGRVVARSRMGLSSSPKVLILSLLSSKWEWPNLNRDDLDRYRTMVDWVRVTQLDGDPL